MNDDLIKSIINSELDEILKGGNPDNFYKNFLKKIEYHLFSILINKTFYNQVKMSKILGMSRQAVRYKMKNHGLL